MPVMGARDVCDVPVGIEFMPKLEIGLCLIDEADEAGVPYQAVILDGAYGGNERFLDGLEERRKKLVAGVPSQFEVRILEEMERRRRTLRRAGRRESPMVQVATPVLS